MPVRLRMLERCAMKTKLPKVICVGMPKTGTTSLEAVFRLMGYRVSGNDAEAMCMLSTDPELKVHGTSLMAKAADCDFLRVDPWNRLYDKLDVKFPDTKFVLTERDPDSWVKSFVAQAKRIQYLSEQPDARPIVKLMHQALPKLYEDAYANGSNEEYLKEVVFHQHNTRVKQYFQDRPDKLITINVSVDRDLNRLCDFIGQPVPVCLRKFPVLNVTKYEH